MMSAAQSNSNPPAGSNLPTTISNTSSSLVAELDNPRDLVSIYMHRVTENLYWAERLGRDSLPSFFQYNCLYEKFEEPEIAINGVVCLI